MLRHSLLINVLFKTGTHIGYPLGRAYQFLNKAQTWTKSQIRDHQNKSFRSLIQHCYKHVPYYHDLMSERGFYPSDFSTVADLAKFPFLTRDIIRHQETRLLAKNYQNTSLQTRRSGGTTGEPIEVLLDIRARAFEVAAYLRGFEWMGYRLGYPMVHLFGGSLGLSQERSIRSRLRDWSFNSRFLPAFELTPDNTNNYVNAINESKNAVLVGYTSAMLNLAEYVSLQTLKVKSLKSVICTAEYMPEDWRCRISQSLGAPTYNYYGCGEVNSLGYECPGEEGYIIPQEHVILEASEDNEEIFYEEGRGQACITTLYNYAMPLLRYRNGDLIELRYSQTGRSHKRIMKLEGRIIDQLISNDGHNVSGAFVPHLVFRSGFPAWKYQIIQIEPNVIEFHYLLREGENLSIQISENVMEVFHRHLGNDLVVNFIYDKFEYSSSGKHRLVINRLLE